MTGEGVMTGAVLEAILSHHADTGELGARAARAVVPLLVPAHLIPAPGDAVGGSAFEADDRAGWHKGEVHAGRGLDRFAFGSD